MGEPALTLVRWLVIGFVLGCGWIFAKIVFALVGAALIKLGDRLDPIGAILRRLQ